MSVSEVKSGESFGRLEPVRLGTGYHSSISRPRHDPLTSILEIVDNVLGRARWDSSVRMTCSHLLMEDFKLKSKFFVAISNTKISREDFVTCLDQRPRADEARSHALSVFGDGMKSSHNCLVDGNGNLFLLVMHREHPDGPSVYWIARYGKAFDMSQGSADVMKLICEWDVDKGCVKGPRLESEKNMHALARNSPFEASSTKQIGTKLNKMFALLTQTAGTHGYDNVFMQVIGPIGQRANKDGAQVGLVSSRERTDQICVWRPTSHDDGELEDVAMAIAQSYVPPDSTLASTPKPHAFQPLNNRPNPNTKLDLFVGAKRVDYHEHNPWCKIKAAASETLEVICDGFKVAELQIKQLQQRGIQSLGQSHPLAADECSGALIAMEGGRLLNRRPDAFFEDGLCTQKLLIDTPARIINHMLSGKSLPEHVGNITRGLEACSDIKFISEKQVRDLTALIGQCRHSKEAMVEAIGGYSVALVQLHVTVVTDPSKTQLDIQRWTSVQLRGEEVIIGPYKLLGAIFRTIVQHTFSAKLEELRALRTRLGQQPSTSSQTGSASKSASSSSALVKVKDGNDQESETPGSRTGSRKRSQAPLGNEPGTPSKQSRLTGTVKGMSKVSVAKAHATWIEKYEEGKCSAEHCISKLKTLMNKYHPV